MRSALVTPNSRWQTTIEHFFFLFRIGIIRKWGFVCDKTVNILFAFVTRPIEISTWFDDKFSNCFSWFYSILFLIFILVFHFPRLTTLKQIQRRFSFIPPIYHFIQSTAGRAATWFSINFLSPKCHCFWHIELCYLNENKQIRWFNVAYANNGISISI